MIKIIKFLPLPLLFFLATESTFANKNCLGDKTALHSYKLYVVPQLTPTQIYMRWSPVLEWVGKESKACFELIVPNSIPQFESDLLEGRPDFAFMNPYHAVMRWRGNKYIPLVASGDPIYGILTVDKDSAIQHIKELSGKRIAFPAPNAFAASLLIRSSLDREGVLYKPVYVKTHSNVYRSVTRGDVVAGGGIQSTLMSEPLELREELRILMETKRYTAHPFSANARVPEKIRKNIQAAFLLLNQEASGPDLLRAVQLTKPMIVSYKTNYESLEVLRLDKYVVRSAD